MQSLAGILLHLGQHFKTLHSGCRYGVTFYDLVISVFMEVGMSADGLCKLVTLRGSCRAMKERRRALLNPQEYKQRRSALFWRLLHFTLWMIRHYSSQWSCSGGVLMSVTFWNVQIPVSVNVTEAHQCLRCKKYWLNGGSLSLINKVK